MTQLGVDSFYDDPLTNLHLSIWGYEKILKKIKALAPRWVALGGGGYNISNVARAWTLAWAVMNGVELQEDLPESFLEEAERKGIEGRKLRGRLRTPLPSQSEENRVEMERVVHYLKETVFPKVKS
jgi:acetoin utilization protein AcuC